MSIAVLIAFALGICILAFTIWAIRFIASGPPPEPDVDDVQEVDIPYLCTVCGMSLTITQATGDDIDPPRHCREDMVKA